MNRNNLIPVVLLFAGAMALMSGNAAAKSKDKESPDVTPQDTLAKNFPYYEDNETCFTCHDDGLYEYTNENTGQVLRRLMHSNERVSRDKYYSSVHRNFACTDCHSWDFNTFPHPPELLFEQYPQCIDCHGGDESYAQYNFEDIQAEYELSVHYELEHEGFSCYKCHNPHEYDPSMRKEDNIRDAISYANSICLSCHANYDRYQLLTNHEEINIVSLHDWLPNEALHFRSVRCIECHTMISDSILIAHHLLPKEEAVRNCVECHSQNSILMGSLYKFQAREERKGGFFNAIILNESYVIGANRNMVLNILSVLFLAGILGIITLHVIIRIRSLKS